MCLYCDCIASEPEVLIGLDALRNSKSNEMRFFHFVAEQLTHLVLSFILGFHAQTVNNTMISLSIKGKNTCWKMFMRCAHLLTRVVYVHYMWLEKRMAEVLMMPGLVFL